MHREVKFNAYSPVLQGFFLVTGNRWTLSPNLVRTYLALASDLDYDLRPGQEGDMEKR